MKKIILVSIIIMSVLSGKSTFADTKVDDVLYFPGGDTGINRMKDMGVNTPTYWSDFWRKYNVLYHGTSEYENDNHKKLYNIIADELDSKLKLEYDIIKSYENRADLEEELEEIALEIKVAKFRYQNDVQANRDEKDIREKLEPLMRQSFESKGKTNAGLQIVESENTQVCGQNVSGDFDFKTVYLNSENIKKYYLFGLRHDAIYGSPWDENHKAEAYIISKEKDLEKIDKSKFFLQEITPRFEEVEYREQYDNSDEEVYIPKGGAVLTQNKVYERIIEENTEVLFTLKQSEYQAYFKKYNNLYNFGNVYTFGPEEGSLREFQFMLLGVEKDGDIRVLTGRNVYENLDLSENINGLKLKEVCDRYFPGTYNDAPYGKILYSKKQQISEIFENLDKKYHLQKYKDFEYSMNHQDMLITEEDYKKSRDKEIGKYILGYKKYNTLIQSFSDVLEKTDTKIENEIYEILVASRKNMVKNKKKLAQKYYFKAIIETLRFQLEERKRLLENV